jgi:K+-transporting ATPase c subunit
MTANGWTQIAIYAAILIALARPLRGYMTAVFDGRLGFLRPVERVRALVARTTQDRFIGAFGELRVNVLKLNLALDALK